MNRKHVSKKETSVPISEIPLCCSQAITNYNYNTSTTNAVPFNSWSISSPQSSLYEPSIFELVQKINEVVRRLNAILPKSPQTVRKSGIHASLKRKQSRKV